MASQKNNIVRGLEEGLAPIFTGYRPDPVRTILFLLGIVALLAIAIYYIYKKTQEQAKPSNIVRVSNEQQVALTTFLGPFSKPKAGLMSFSSGSGPTLRGIEPVVSDERLLCNFQPLTAFNAGFMGPYNTFGVFNEKEGVFAALQTGARCFVLPIDYHEDSTLDVSLFGKPNYPALFYRDNGGNIRSLNVGSIERVASTLAQFAFSNLIRNRQDPLLLVLYFVRTPDAASQPKEFLRFTSQVAKELKPLISTHLGQTPLGSFQRQAMADQLLYLPISTFENKTLIFSNLDTTLFRKLPAGVAPFRPDEDLDYLVHLRLYKNSTNALGTTPAPDSGVVPRGIVDTLSYFTTLPEPQYKDVVASTKIRWTMAISPVGVNPTPQTAELLLKKLGVQSLPLQMAAMDEDTQKVMALWNAAAWLPKPKALRFVVPKPYVPTPPPPQLNSNQGRVTAPTL